MSDSGLASGMSMQGGRVMRVNIEDFSVQDISIRWQPDPIGHPGVYETDYNPANIQLAWGIQAENFFIIQDGQSKPFIWNGGSSSRATQNQIPVASQMTYYMGRIWLAQGRKYVGGDIVFGPSGTASLGYRDSILYMTENSFLVGGGAFGVPASAGQIVALKPIANINTALGQGDLIIFCENNVFASLVPQDRTTWNASTTLLQRVVQLSNGAYAQDSVVNVNEDLFYRSDGIRSLAFSVRNVGQWGNTPISNEVQEIISFDSEAYLQYGSGVNFDNRMLMTCSPSVAQGHGIYHRGVVVLDFDLITGIQEQKPPAWEGLWNFGLNILKIFTVKHRRQERCFMYVLNSNDEIEMWELTKTNLFDNDGTQDLRIQWSLDTRSMDFGSKFDGNRLFAGDVFIDNVSGQVDISLQYRPDSYPCWIDWDSWTECAKVFLCAEDMVACQTLPNFRPQYRPYHQLKQPSDAFDPILKTLYRVGYEMQFRHNINGYCRLKQFRANAYQTQQAPYGSNWK